MGLYRDPARIVWIVPAGDAPVPPVRYATAKARRPRRSKRKTPVDTPPERPIHRMDTFLLWYGQRLRIGYWWSFAEAELDRMLPI